MNSKTKWLVALRFAGQDRKLFHITVTASGDYYAALRYGAYTPPGFPPLDCHMSYHPDGRRRLALKDRRRLHPACHDTDVMRQPTAHLRGVEQFAAIVGFKGQLETLSLLRGYKKPFILLDGDAAGFRDDAFCIKTYLVEPYQQHKIPLSRGVGPRILHLETSVTPWVAIEVFQQA